MTELAQVISQQQLLLAKFDELRRLVMQRKPMTRQQFADTANVSYRTVQRMLDRKEIREVNGRIPAHYADQYLS